MPSYQTILMFGTSAKDPKTSAQTSLSTNGTGGDLTCVIAKGTVIEGKFTCSENVRLDGTIIGEVRVEKKLVMGDTGLIQGNTIAQNSAIKGRIKGDIVVRELLHLLDTARVEGTIKSRTMIVDEGAQHNGHCQIGEKK